ncbi:MAG TPA: YhdP family protein [Cellvibrio sp.]|nr:YhdP family protein [Cellvibrio sp.]
MTAVLRKLVKWFYICFAVAAIGLAVLVQAGRSFSHLLGDYPQQISRYLSDQFNANVSIGSLRAEWKDLKPMLEVRQLRITSQSDQPIFALDQAELRLDLLDSLLHGRLVWSSLTLREAHLDFVQTDKGFWRIPGLPQIKESPEQEAADLDSLIDMLLLSRHIEIDRSHFNFEFASGEKTLLESPSVRIENADGFHRLTLQVDVDNRPKSLLLTVEAKGDPRNSKRFSSDAFLELNQFPTNAPIAAATALLLHGTSAEIHSEGTLNAKLWFKSRPEQSGFEVVGQAGIERLSLPVKNHKLVLDSFTTDLVGRGLYSGQWQLALQNINTRIGEHLVEKVNLAASSDNFDAPIVLHMQHINLEHLNHALDSSGVWGEARLREIMRKLDPRGELRNIEVAIPKHKLSDWQLSANLYQVANNAWQGVPALNRLDGFVTAGQRGGHVDIDSQQGFSMHYSPTFSDPMEFDRAKGQVAWSLQPENNQIYVNSGALEFIQGEEQAKGYMWLAMPWKHGTGDVDLYLQIGAKQLGASQYRKFTPAVVPQSLLTWLGKSIGENNSGHVSEGGFVYRATLSDRAPAAHTHQLYLDIHQASLDYHPEWPALTELSGRLLVDDNHVRASVDQGKLFSSDLQPTQIDVSPNPAGAGAILHVDGAVSGTAADGLRVLRESMLRQYIGANMDTWSLEGSMQTKVNIAVPLERDAPGAAQQIDIELAAPSFAMGNLKLSMRDIKGHISYNQDSGIASEGLQAHLFDEPVIALLSTKKQAHSSQTLIDVKGEVDSRALANWSQRPEALFLRGKIPYSAHIELNHRARSEAAGKNTAATPADAAFAVVTVTSQLAGVAVDLPAPYTKEADAERSLVYNMSLYDNKSLVDVSYGDNLQALFELESRNNNKLHNANIALGGQAQLHAQPQFLLSGQLPSLDIEPWKKVQQRYQDYQDQLSLGDENNLPEAVAENSALVAGLPFRAEVLLDHYQVGPLSLAKIDVQAARLAEAWTVQFANPIVKGDIYLPNDQAKPLQINLQELRLSREILEGKPAAESTPENTASEVPIRGPSIDPRTLPLANVSVKQLYMDDKSYGNWSLQIRPNQRGVVFDNIQGSIRDVTVSDADNAAAGARLTWTLGEQGAETHFSGLLSATDLSTVLQQWQKPDTIESSSAKFRVNLSWAGDPQDFSLKKLSGNMDVLIEKGRFKRSPSVSSDGFLRLLSILNFDSLARRLRLDFSDLYKSGLAYDQISGKVQFEPGIMTFAEPLVVQTPSSRLQMAGKLDLNRERINTRLVAALPVASNLTFVAALATGLPAAAGVYLVSKLFKKQVDQAASVSYRITGKWDDPQMSFDRLFESEESLRDSVNAKELPEPPPALKPEDIAPTSKPAATP